ncbi:MAG: hypothetical protein R2932_11575 [Caldilineaceae bacterium]
MTVCDAATVVQLLKRADVRLLTLLGPPDWQNPLEHLYSRQPSPILRDGIWFVDLAPINDALSPSAIRSVLSVAEVGITPLLDRLHTHVGSKRAAAGAR